MGRTVLTLVVGFIVGNLFTLYGYEYLAIGYKHFIDLALIAFLVVVIVAVTILIVKDWIFKKLFGRSYSDTSLLSDSRQFTNAVAENLSELATKGMDKDKKLAVRAVAPGMINYFLWGKIRSWYIGVLFGLVLTIGGLLTTVLLTEQNNLIKLQNEKIATQSTLMEAERRGGQVLFMGNLLNDLSKEIDAQESKIGSYTLSDQLIAKIAATTKGLVPYQFLQNGKVTEEEYSIERGQLLHALMNSGLDTTTLQKIFKIATFEDSYLPNVDWSDRDLYELDLSGSDLSWSTLFRCSIKSANIQRMRFDNISGDGLDFSGKILHGCSFIGAGLSDANLSEVGGVGVDFTQADLMQANFDGAYFRDANFTDVSWSAYLPFKGNLRTPTGRPGFAKKEVYDKVYDAIADRLSRADGFVDCIGLDENIVSRLRKLKPCLFERNGCTELPEGTFLN
jgi:uncharacterized protein YjbI with pentapeptide repeats